MPDTESPKLSLWLPKLQEVVGEPNEELFLIGHSVGCMAILRYLEQLKENEKVGGVILVAGFTDNLGSGYQELESFFQTPLRFEKIKSSAKHFVAINSDNDPHVSPKFGNILEKELGAKLLIKRMGHFSGPLDDPKSVTSLPDVTKQILEMAK